LTPARIVAGVWVIVAVANGLFFSFSIFFVPLVEEFRWSRALTAGALSLSTLIQGLLAPLVGIVVDRVGPRSAILGGVALLGVASILASTISSPLDLYLYTGLLGALGFAGVGSVPMGVLLSRWIDRRRGRMVGIAFSGMGVGIFVIGPLAQWLISTLGWRAASAILGVAVLALVLPFAWLVAHDPSPAHPHATDTPDGTQKAPGDASLRQAMATRAFWALFGAYLLTPLAVFPVFIHQVAFAVDLGFPRLLVAWIFGFVGLMSSLGRVGFGVIVDRFGGPPAAILSFACTAGGAFALLALEVWPHDGWLYAYALLFGLGFGARGPIITTMASELFGGRRFGLIWGILNLANGIGGAVGPWFGGAVHDVTGSYRVAFVSSVGFSALGAWCFWLARPRAA